MHSLRPLWRSSISQVFRKRFLSSDDENRHKDGREVKCLSYALKGRRIHYGSPIVGSDACSIQSSSVTTVFDTYEWKITASMPGLQLYLAQVSRRSPPRPRGIKMVCPTKISRWCAPPRPSKRYQDYGRPHQEVSTLHSQRPRGIAADAAPGAERWLGCSSRSCTLHTSV